MIRGGLVEHRRQFEGREISGTITVVYNHHRSNVQPVLTDLRHDHRGHDNCLEVIVVRWKAQAVKKPADQRIAARGRQAREAERHQRREGAAAAGPFAARRGTTRDE